jgi:hypothetical protein
VYPTSAVAIRCTFPSAGYHSQTSIAQLLIMSGRLRIFILVHMARGHFKLLARLGTGVFMLVVVQNVCAPVSAWAGCSHLVSSRADSGRPPSVIDSLVHNLAGRNEPAQAPLRPCTGAWCSGQPATPAVPASEFNWGGESWAWWFPGPLSADTSSIFGFPALSIFHSLHRQAGIFHPPRDLGCAEKLSV